MRRRGKSLEERTIRDYAIVATNDDVVVVRVELLTTSQSVVLATVEDVLSIACQVGEGGVDGVVVLRRCQLGRISMEEKGARRKGELRYSHCCRARWYHHLRNR